MRSDHCDCGWEDGGQIANGSTELWSRRSCKSNEGKANRWYQRITGGKGVNAVFDFVVNNESIENSTKILANTGRLILVGIGREPVVMNPKRLTFKEASVVGSNVGSKEELQLLVDLASSGRLKGVANSRHRLNEVNEVLTALKKAKSRKSIF